MAALSLNILVQPCRDIQHTVDETLIFLPPLFQGMHLGLNVRVSSPCFLANVFDPAYYSMVKTH